MPSELHEQLAQAAEREDLSLNRYVTQALSSTVDPKPAAPALQSSTMDLEPAGPSLNARTVRVALATNLAIVVVAAVAAVVLLVLAIQHGI